MCVAAGGGGGSGGAAGVGATLYSSSKIQWSGGGGLYGGGGGGSPYIPSGYCVKTGAGAQGAVRVIWGNGNITRSFPSTNTGNI
jgi:hypothetical protein